MNTNNSTWTYEEYWHWAFAGHTPEGAVMRYGTANGPAFQARHRLAIEGVTKAATDSLSEADKAIFDWFAERAGRDLRAAANRVAFRCALLEVCDAVAGTYYDFEDDICEVLAELLWKDKVEALPEHLASQLGQACNQSMRRILHALLDMAHNG